MCWSWCSPLLPLGTAGNDRQGMTGTQGMTGNDRDRQPGRAEADTTLCWGTSTELLSARSLCSVCFCLSSLQERSPRGGWMHREDAARGNIELFQPQMSQCAQTRSVAGSGSQCRGGVRGTCPVKWGQFGNVTEQAGDIPDPRGIGKTSGRRGKRENEGR